MLIYKISDITKPFDVEVTSVFSMDITGSIVCSGKIASSFENDVYSKSPIRVTDVNVSCGDTVEAGDILFTAEPITSSILGDEIGDLYSEELKNIDVVSVFNSILGGFDSNLKTVSYISLDSDKTYVKSPISGVVSSINVSNNSVVSNAVSLVTILDPTEIIVNASVPEKLIKDVWVGMECVVTGSGFDGKYLGHVASIKPYARQTQTITGVGETVVDIEISLDSPDKSLLPGFSADAELICEKVNDALMIPYECITQDEENRELVYVVYDNCAYRRYIETGYELSDSVEIKSGLSFGEKVIVSPDVNLTNGDVVKVVSNAVS